MPPGGADGTLGAECSIPVPYFVWSGSRAPALLLLPLRKSAAQKPYSMVSSRWVCAARRAARHAAALASPVLQPKRAGRAFQHFRKAAGQRLVAAEVHQSFRIMKLMDGGMAFVVIVHTELCCVKIKLRAGSCADKARAAPPGVVFYKKCLMV